MRSFYTNTSINSNLKSSSENKPIIINNEINYFLYSPYQDNDMRTGTEITKQIQRDFEDVLVE